jgi:hypothetical protein
MEAPSIESVTLDTLEIVAGPHYEKYSYPHAEWAYLRRHAPVYRYSRENVVPFWRSPGTPISRKWRVSRGFSSMLPVCWR